MTEERARELAVDIAADGIEAHHGELTAFVAAALRRGGPGVVLDVVADPAAPAVARERAFGRALVAYVETGVAAERPLEPATTDVDDREVVAA